MKIQHRFPLKEFLTDAEWMRTSNPFPHAVAQNVFKKRVYQELESAFDKVLSRGLAEAVDSTRFARNMMGYDAYSFNLTEDITGPLRLFISREWHDKLAGFISGHATGDLEGALHHHKIGSRTGIIHNDFNPGWFVSCPRPDGINVSRRNLCRYDSGYTFATGLVANERIRALAMIFYLNNPPWSKGDGGETGLFASSRDSVSKPSSFVPPVNNSILLFECTPTSYHTFLCNRKHPRNSVILWLHRLKTDVISLWGEKSIVHWPQRNKV
jgi:hypothetical protein